MAWLRRQGGLAAMAERNARKAAMLYAEIDRSGFYRGHAQEDCRSKMNVTFRLPSEELEARFVKEATAVGLDGLKGHRSWAGSGPRSTTPSPRRGSRRWSPSCGSSSARAAEPPRSAARIPGAAADTPTPAGADLDAAWLAEAGRSVCERLPRVFLILIGVIVAAWLPWHAAARARLVYAVTLGVELVAGTIAIAIARLNRTARGSC